MTELQATLAALTGDDRRFLAHALVLAIEGRAAPVSDGSIPAADVPPVPTAFAGAPSPADDAPTPAQAAPDAVRRQTRPISAAGVPSAPAASAAPGGGRRPVSAPEASPRSPGDAPAARLSPLSPGERTAGPSPAAVPGEASAFRALSASPISPADPQAGYRAVSDYFCQDSRRYDPGFTRY